MACKNLLSLIDARALDEGLVQASSFQPSESQLRSQEVSVTWTVITSLRKDRCFTSLDGLNRLQRRMSELMPVLRASALAADDGANWYANLQRSPSGKHSSLLPESAGSQKTALMEPALQAMRGLSGRQLEAFQMVGAHFRVSTMPWVFGAWLSKITVTVHAANSHIF